jgi:hypothetical protein
MKSIYFEDPNLTKHMFEGHIFVVVITYFIGICQNSENKKYNAYTKDRIEFGGPCFYGNT